MNCRQTVVGRAIVGLALLGPLFCCAVHARSSTTRGETWPESDLYVGLNAKSRFFFQYTATREDELRTYADGQVGGFFDFYMAPLVQRLREHPDASRDKLLMFRIGYAYSRTQPRSSKPSIDHIPTIEATSRFPLPWALLLSDRNRGDLRIANGAWSPRYRNRLKLERTFKAGRFHLTPYVDSEVFYEWRYDKFDEVRYASGMEWSIAHFLLLDLYCTRQRTTTSSPQFVNALGGKLEFFLRNKRD